MAHWLSLRRMELISREEINGIVRNQRAYRHHPRGLHSLRRCVQVQRMGAQRYVEVSALTGTNLNDGKLPQHHGDPHGVYEKVY